MKVERAQEIFNAKETIAVRLDNGPSVWIEEVDLSNGMATVQIGQNPLNTETVSVDRLSEGDNGTANQ